MSTLERNNSLGHHLLVCLRAADVDVFPVVASLPPKIRFFSAVNLEPKKPDALAGYLLV